MKTLLALTLSAFLATAAPAAAYTQQDLNLLTGQLGFPAIEYVEVPADERNAYFWEGGLLCEWMFFCEERRAFVAVEGDWSKLPPELWLAIVLHELGHYDQYLDGREFDEWDADVFAANALCGMGLDGLYWTEALERSHEMESETDELTWGSPSRRHGTLMQRVENVRVKAHACRDQFLQA